MKEALIYKQILDIYVEHCICLFPIDCFDLLERYGFTLKTYKQIEQDNIELFEVIKKYSDDAFRYCKTIYYNSSQNPNRIRFSLMHELGHYILKHTGQTQENEDEADFFASNILAPRAIMCNLNCNNAEDVHTVFEISYAAANRAWYDCRNRVWNRYDQAIKEHFYPPTPILPETSAPQLIEAEVSEPEEKLKLSPEAHARKQRILSQIKKSRRNTQKKLKEYEEDMKVLNFNDDEAFNRAERQWLFGNDL